MYIYFEIMHRSRKSVLKYASRRSDRNEEAIMTKLFKQSSDRIPERRTRSAKKKAKHGFSVRKWDPLFIIFEKHLYDFNYESRALFIKSVIDEYMKHLTKQKVIVPPAWRMQLEKNLAEEISDMLVRKLYGCLSVEDFKEKNVVHLGAEKKEVRKRYVKLVG